MFELKEEHIENEILCYLMERGVKVSWKNDIKGFFNTKKGHYQKNKSNFIRNGISDISFLIDGKFICIEVKKPSEMKFFDRDIKTLRQEFAFAQFRVKDPKKYLHAVEQREFLDDIISEGGIGFFASSVDEVVNRLSENGVNF